MMQAITGVNVAAITPHGKRGDEPDIGATLDLIDFLCAAGVQGIALLGSTEAFIGLGILVPSRNAELVCWCLERGLRIVQQSTLMTIGLYNEPDGAYLPSILF